MISPLRVVLIGAGTRARKLYLPWLAGQIGPLARAVAVLDTDPGASAAAAELTGGVPACPQQLPDVLAATPVDLVVVATPDHTHRGYAEQALTAGLACLVEKPLATTPDDVGALAAAAAAGPGRLLVGHNLRFTNLHRRVRHLLAGGHLGTVQQVAFRYRLTREHTRSYHTRWHRHRAASGGMEVTKATHHIDLLTWWLRTHPTTVSATLTRRHHRPGVDGVPADADIHDTIHARIGYRTGVTVDYQLGCDRDGDEGYTCIVTATAGTCTITYRARCGDHLILLAADDRSPATRIVVGREPGSHAGADTRMLAALPDALTGAATDFAAAAEAAEAVTVGTAMHASHLAGRPLPVCPSALCEGTP